LTDKIAAIHDLELGYQEFRSPLHRLDDAEFSETWLGTWNLSQLLAHMAGWFGEMTEAIRRVERGERPTPEGVDYSNADSWNAKFAESAKPGKAALEQFDGAYQGYLAAANDLPPELFGVDEASGKPKIGNRLLQGAGIGHFAEHQPALDEWLKAREANK